MFVTCETILIQEFDAYKRSIKEQQETIEAGKHMEESYLKSSIMFSVIHQWTARILSVHGQRNSELVESVSNSNVKCQALSAWCDAASAGKKISCRSGVPKPSVSKIAKIRNMHLKGYMFYQKANVKWIAKAWYTKYEMWIYTYNGKQRIAVQQKSHNRMEL